MREYLRVPLLEELAPEGFWYGGQYIVEFDPDSLWYETSLTIAASALKRGMKTEYHVFQHDPSEAIEAFSGLGVDGKRMEKEGLLSIWDGFTATTKYEALPKSTRKFRFPLGPPLNFSAMAAARPKEDKTSWSEQQKGWLHLDDNTGVMLQYNDEDVFIDTWRTAMIPNIRDRKCPHFLGFPKGVMSSTFLAKFEALCDGIIDVKSEQEEGQISHYLRIRMLRGRACDTKWHRLQMLQTGEVLLGGTTPRQGRRKLSAIMFTDLAGYTALAQKDEPRSLRVLQQHRQALRPMFSKHGGREVKTMGDGFLVEFASALDAMKCAFDIQGQTRDLNLSVPTEDRIQLRIGIHVGDVVESEGDILGDAVNVASRIDRLAVGGGIAVSQQVYDQVRNKFELTIKSLGKKRLKNVTLPVEVYRVVLPWENRTGRARAKAMQKKPSSAS
jgi:class 3 adenylate cyclase